ncbi:MAG: T9SS type A sorting domain-containing protein [bacterium]|nr:T9SS type A sorting domain-containing protein [bacterium]
MDTTGNPADTVTIAFTTYAALAANDTIKVEFPATFTFTSPAVDAANTAMTTANKPTLDSSSDSTILLLVPGSITAGNQSVVLTGINNPSAALKDVEITLQTFRQGGQDTVHYADQTQVNFDIRGTLQLMTAEAPIIENRMDGLATVGDTNVVLTTFRLAALGEQSILSQVQVTPYFIYMTTAEINLLDIYKDLNGDGYLDTNDPSIGTAPVNDSGSGTTVAINVSDTVAEGDMNYLVVAAFKSTIGDGDSVRIDVEDITNITASGIISQVAPYGIGSAITGYYHKATPPVINIVSTTLTKTYFGSITDIEVEFTTNQNLDSLSDEIVVVFPSQLDITNIDLDRDRTVTGSGEDPHFNSSESSGDTLVLDIQAAEPKGSHTLYFTDIQNPDSVHDNLYLEIYTRLDDNTLVDSLDLSPALFDIVSKLSLHEAKVDISENNLSDLAHTGGTAIPVTAFKMIRQKEEIDFTSLVVRPFFSGMSSSAFQKIDIYEDNNGNGVVDAGESSITLGTGDENGSQQMVGINTTGYTFSDDTMNFIVTVDLSNELGVTDSLSITIPRLDNSTMLGAVTGSRPFIYKPEITGIMHVVEGFELTGVSDTTLVEAQNLRITPQYVTTYTGTPSFSAGSLPEYAEIDPTTGLFSWAPEFAQAGLHEVIYSGSLNGVTSLDTFYVQVGEGDIAGTVIADSSDINGSTGGTVNAGENSLYTGHSVTIPAGAYTGSKNIVIRRPSQSAIPSAQINQVPSAVEFIVSGEGSGYVFDDSVTITLEYKPFEITNSENRMRVHLWDNVMGIWKRVRGAQTINYSSNTIRTKIKHFSVYGVIETSDTTAAYSMGRGWNMLSFPVYPVDVTDPEELLSDDIYPFRFMEGNSSIYYYSELESDWKVPESIENGIGYILYGFYNSQLDIDGANEYADIDLELSYTNSNGWHLLGNPYSEDINWDSDVVVGSGIDNKYYRWSNGQYIFYPGGGASADIEPWQGFFVRTTTDGADFGIVFPGISKRAGSQETEIDWRMQITAESGESRDIHNYLGSSRISNELFDENDVYELVPLNGEFITAFFPHEDWETNPANYTQDIRNIMDESISWDFKVMTNSSSGKVDLKWLIPDEIAPEYDVVMTVPGTGEKIDMRKQSEYSYDIPITMRKENDENRIPFVNNDPTNFSALYKSTELFTETFTIIIGKGINEIPAVTPDSYFLKQNYPNPFNPDTNIEFGLPQAGSVSMKIYNILGQEIRTLVNGDYEAGVHRVRWDARNNYGIRVASGVYIYRIQAENYTQIKKMILIR